MFQSNPSSEILYCSTATKLRIVFDALSKTSSNISMNDIIHWDLKFQQYVADRVVFTADIEKSFRNIKVRAEDLLFYGILWDLKEFELTTITYGFAASPFLSKRTLKQFAKDEELSYSEKLE